VAEHGDWAVYTAQAGRSKICYALAQPKDRLPKTVNRDPAYLFVSFRPTENVRNEIALVMGFPTKEDGPAEAVIGSTNYALLTKEANAWLKNPAEESQAIATMSRGQNLLVKVSPAAAPRSRTAIRSRASPRPWSAPARNARRAAPVPGPSPDIRRSFRPWALTFSAHSSYMKGRSRDR
jgi:hypothetical protein